MCLYDNAVGEKGRTVKTLLIVLAVLMFASVAAVAQSGTVVVLLSRMQPNVPVIVVDLLTHDSRLIITCNADRPTCVMPLAGYKGEVIRVVTGGVYEGLNVTIVWDSAALGTGTYVVRSSTAI
jgi:hypothetical protein